MLYRGEHEVVLPPKAIETLIALIELRGEIVSKGDLMKIIWADTIVEESNLDHYLHVLRKTLGQKNDGQPFIETLRRRGYRFTPDVQVSEAPNRNGTRLARQIRILLNSRIEMRVRRVRQVWPPSHQPLPSSNVHAFTFTWCHRRSCRLIRVGGDLVFSAAEPSKPSDVTSARRDLCYATDQRKRDPRRDHFAGRKVFCLLRAV